MLDLIAGSDVAVSAAGFTPYELACAGVPAVVVSVADNQVPVARALDRAGVAIGSGRRRTAGWQPPLLAWPTR